METFSAGDRVVAINTDLSAPIHDPSGSPLSAFTFPDGLLRKDVIYHVESVRRLAGGNLGLLITGLRVFLQEREIVWDSSRFRKVQDLKQREPEKRRRRQPVEA